MEGHTDRVFLERAAKLAKRPDLLDGLVVVAAEGAESAALRAATWKGFNGKDVLTYATFCDGLTDAEAEDLLSGECLEAFVAAHGGEEAVLDEKRWHNGRCRYGVKQRWKGALADWVGTRAKPGDVAGFIPSPSARHSLTKRRWASVSGEVRPARLVRSRRVTSRSKTSATGTSSSISRQPTTVPVRPTPPQQ